jgi:hypothetical protein
VAVKIPDVIFVLGVIFLKAVEKKLRFFFHGLILGSRSGAVVAIPQIVMDTRQRNEVDERHDGRKGRKSEGHWRSPFVTATLSPKSL